MSDVPKTALKKLFSQAAASGAKKICNGSCISGIPCNRPEMKASFPAPQRPFNPGNTNCPLSVYPVCKQTKPWYECRREELEPSQDEIFSLCALCENSNVTEDGDSYVLERVSLKNCMDCPVKMCEENMQELAAEAAMS